jgi:hypothetical protein
MNPSLPKRVVDEAMDRDPDAARAEYGAEFRSDLETFLIREVVDALVRARVVGFGGVLRQSIWHRLSYFPRDTFLPVLSPV